MRNVSREASRLFQRINYLCLLTSDDYQCEGQKQSQIYPSLLEISSKNEVMGSNGHNR